MMVCKRQRWLWLTVFLAVMSGCGTDPYGVGGIVPVAGKIMVDGKPLLIPGGGVGKTWFYPDAGRGNVCPQVPVGTIDEEGAYRLFTRDREGAPPGWYKVMIVAMDRESSNKGKPLVPGRYSDVATSGLTVEVTERPGGGTYDLQLKREE